MGGSADLEALRLISAFSEEFTLLVDRAFGTNWVGNEEVLALVRIATVDGSTTREIAQVSGLNRRTLSRLVGRLQDDGIVTVERSPADARAIAVRLTPLGRARVRALPGHLAERLKVWAPEAAEIVTKLGGARVPDKVEPLELLRRIALVGTGIVDHMRNSAPGGPPLGRQSVALEQIAANPGIRPAQLSPALSTGRGGAAYVIDQLCATGLIVRRRGAVPGDARAVVLEATPEGARIVRQRAEAIVANRAPLASLFSDIAAFGTAANVASPRTA
ncbi:MarR family winged helix-turn-helix transcriptional regulator [Agromyces sp. SYSU T00194]|uniref:MarR family winged helix-turn-helix transcriptional regulator n=1 Tax=Agromyces chitinivorans TaxID=3158560 RepID=UPI003391D2B6